MLPIVTEPNPILHQKTAEIDPAIIGDAKFAKLVKGMAETMYLKDGVGIAAPQVGSSHRVCVIAKNYNTYDKSADLILINPVWEKLGPYKIEDEEGCLSVPNIYGKVKRYKKIKVSALDGMGRKINFIAKDFFARIVQHECDHLNGVLFIEKAKDLHEMQKDL